MPVSSHPVWRVKDYELIESVVKDVIKKYRLNPESPVFFGGFSNGAEVALKLVFSSKIKTKGVFAFAGGIRLIKNRSLIKKSDRNLAVFLSCGKNDANWIGSTLYSYNYLKKNNFKNLTVKGYAGLEHWISREQALFFLDWIEKNS
jgi:predicted esterase